MTIKFFKNDCIGGEKAFLGTAGNPRQKYLVTYLESKGCAALQNPRILNQEPSGITINQSGNFGIGQMSGGKIEEGAKVAGVINEAEKPTLAEVAAEIQQLLEKLSSTNPTTTTEQMMVATEAIKQIESDPNWKQRVINAAKEAGLAALEKAIDNPVGAVLTAGIKGWLEAKAE